MIAVVCGNVESTTRLITLAPTTINMHAKVRLKIDIVEIGSKAVVSLASFLTSFLASFIYCMFVACIPVLPEWAHGVDCCICYGEHTHLVAAAGRVWYQHVTSKSVAAHIHTFTHPHIHTFTHSYIHTHIHAYCPDWHTFVYIHPCMQIAAMRTVCMWFIT